MSHTQASFALLEYLRVSTDDRETLRGKTVLELGSGVGAVGIGAARTADRVFISDVADVVPLMQANVDLNEASNVTALALDWFAADLPGGLAASPPDLVLASDVVYDPCLHAPLLGTLESLLNGLKVPLCLLAHRHRNPHDADFFDKLTANFDTAERFLPAASKARVPNDVRLFAVAPKTRTPGVAAT